jgi:PKD repeat protein
VNLGLKADVTLTPQELATLRTLADNGAAGTPVRLLLSETPLTDTISLPCGDAAGSDIGYDLGTLSAMDGVSMLDSAVFDVGTATPSSTAGVESLASSAHPTVALGPVAGSMTMSGPGIALDLGTLLANDVPPKVSAGGPYTGTVGAPIAFDGTGSSNVCGPPSLEWTFSDGTVASGGNPQHMFTSPGLFAVRLTATDASGLTSSTTIDVPVTAVTPVVTAGPDQTTEWGLPVPFNGTANEAGTGATATLTGGWTFGDGNAAAGANVTNEYETPGVYSATFTSCDPSTNLCDAASTQVTVTKRGTTAAYTGATASDPGGNVMYAASVLDDQGDPVPDVPVGFYADDSVTPFTTAMTDSMGFAFATSAFPHGAVGSHTVTVRFAGDSLYTGSSYGPVGYTVTTDSSPADSTGSPSCSSALCTTPSTLETSTRLGTTIAYTGATASDVTGRVIYAASVLDVQGDPVAGRVVNFYADGSTTPFTSALTNSMGFAFATAAFPLGTTGNHFVTARFAGDWRYTGSSYGPVPYTVNTAGAVPHVAKLGTTIAYTGATTSEVTGQVLYAASVLDDLGDPVAGGVVDFYADDSTTPFASAATNSMGFAFATSSFPGGSTAIHTVTARYAGNADYTGSSYGPVPYSLSMDALSGN